jgi:hypothetical protein
MSDAEKLLKCAAIVCQHVACGGAPIMRAVRDLPEIAEDSGWQFLCGESVEEDPERAEVWILSEVISTDPSIKKFIHLPPGCTAVREHDGGWSFHRSS